jgi:hypothetical protein
MFECAILVIGGNQSITHRKGAAAGRLSLPIELKRRDGKPIEPPQLPAAQPQPQLQESPTLGPPQPPIPQLTPPTQQPPVPPPPDQNNQPQ